MISPLYCDYVILLRLLLCPGLGGDGRGVRVVVLRVAPQFLVVLFFWSDAPVFYVSFRLNEGYIYRGVYFGFCCSVVFVFVVFV